MPTSCSQSWDRKGSLLSVLSGFGLLQFTPSTHPSPHCDFPCHHAVLPQFLFVQLLFVLQDQCEEDELAGFDKLQFSGLPSLGHLQHWLLVLLLLYAPPVPSLFHASKIVYIFQAFYFKVMAGGKHFIAWTPCIQQLEE